MDAHPTPAPTPRKIAATVPTLRDRARRCRVEYAFGDFYKVTGESGRLYAVKATWDDRGREVTAECHCADKKFNHAEKCKHELAVVMFERARVSEAQGFYC